VYVGRIDENKGCNELFRFFEMYLRGRSDRLSLVLIGQSRLEIPAHPRIRHLGFLDDADKFDAIAASELLVVPSYYESLSMVALEAWALGRPVLANAKCDVLLGQCIRSNAGLYYENEQEFVETLRAMSENRWLSGSLGRNGRQFYRENYDWPVIDRKYLTMLDRLTREPATSTMEPLPGWLARRRRDCRPATGVVATLPQGPLIDRDSPARTAQVDGPQREPLRAQQHPTRPAHPARGNRGRPFRRSRSRPAGRGGE
jgi:hypothetical protein